jgi:hypothetical protein
LWQALRGRAATSQALLTLRDLGGELEGKLAVIDDIPNKTGVPLVWPAYYPDINIIWIRCFMPGAGA